MKRVANALRPKTGTDTVHVPAPACMFSNGLPLPFAGDSVSSEPDADVGDAPCVVGPEAWAVDGVSVGLVLPPTVDVMVAPVLMPVGPMTMGTMICSVLPSPSVVVFV
jgi:hypothetical protein